MTFPSLKDVDFFDVFLFEGLCFWHENKLYKSGKMSDEDCKFPAKPIVGFKPKSCKLKN